MQLPSITSKLSQFPSTCFAAFPLPGSQCRGWRQPSPGVDSAQGMDGAIDVP